MEEKWSIEKLDGSKLQMAKDLWKFVDVYAVLAEDASGNDSKKFLSEQQNAFSTIVMSVLSSLLYLITSCELPKDAWDTLKTFWS